MARIPYFDRANAVGVAKARYQTLPKINIFDMLGHSGDLLDGFVAMGKSILYAELDPVLREIAVLRTGMLCDASYEVHQHKAIARKLGMSDALIAAIEVGPDDPEFTPLQRLVMLFTDDVVKNVRAADATFNPIVEALGYRQTQELVLTIGWYILVSCFLETFDVDIEGQESFFAGPGGDIVVDRPRA